MGFIVIFGVVFMTLLIAVLANAQGEAPEVGSELSSSTTQPTTSNIHSSTTSIVVDEGCDSSTLGLHWDLVNLIQPAANVTEEGGCCMACTSFEYCSAWSFNQNSGLCELFSMPQEGSIPVGSSAIDWISGSRSLSSTKSYDCNMDMNCNVCRSSIGTCSKCDNNHYLLGGECVVDCSSHGYINFGSLKRNRKCVAPFTCTAPDCECPSDDFGKFCLKCQIAYDATKLCEECRSDRYVVDGKCRLEVNCKRYNFEELPDVSCNCRTPELLNNCFRCSQQGGFTASQPTISCKRCRNELYLDLDSGLCISSSQCPNGTVPTGSGSYGRECLVPSLCKRGKHEATGRTCNCLDRKNCFQCKYDENGYACVRCKESTYLLNGECLSSCPSSHAHANTRSSYGRICAPENFTCDHGISSTTSDACNCRDKNCNICSYTTGNDSTQSLCLQCASNFSLKNDGACTK
eukprot:m.14284 g.14284  ORF g.14284 m.14284 type:complete len:461 (+) comp4282_c0_seq2:77-1459(+)